MTQKYFKVIHVGYDGIRESMSSNAFAVSYWPGQWAYARPDARSVGYHLFVFIDKQAALDMFHAVGGEPNYEVWECEAEFFRPLPMFGTLMLKHRLRGDHFRTKPIHQGFWPLGTAMAERVKLTERIA